MNNYDKINVPLFKAGKNNSYLCSMCGQYTTLSDSASSKGWNLICNNCLYKMAHIFDEHVGNLITKLQNVGNRRSMEEESQND